MKRCMAIDKEWNMSLFTNKTLMITGGTGSFGNAVLNKFLATDIGEIRIFSRDEKKQDDMRHEFQAKMPEVADKIKFRIGDVRDIASVRNAMNGVDYIFHAAALKQVPSCEFFPIEAVKTNVFGTENVLTAAIEEGVKAVICLSTDKAAYPVNAMGTSKAMMEKVIVAKARTAINTKICCTRYGNVMCSRGSVIPLWIDQIRAGNPITITEPKMTRFIMSLEEAVELVLFAFENGHSGDILVQKAPACTIETQAKAVMQLFGGKEENMSNSLKGLMLAAGVIITCMVISIGFFIAREAKDIASQGVEQMGFYVEDMANGGIDFYDGMVVSGSEVERTMKRLYTRTGILVRQKNGSTAYVDSTASDIGERIRLMSLNPHGSFLGSVEYDEKGKVKCLVFNQE